MWSSHATHRPVAYSGLHARQPRRAALVHTNGGGSDNGSLYGWWASHANGSMGRANLHIGAHFQVMRDGQVEQYVDTDLVVYHAYSASEWAVGFEVEDDGDPSRPMTAAQLASIAAICRELGIPARQVDVSSGADGIGWHSQYAAWNQSGHECPGPVRVGQVRSVLIPALRAPAPAPAPSEEDDMLLCQDPRSGGWWLLFANNTKRPVVGGASLAAYRRALKDVTGLTPAEIDSYKAA